jgi:hypothetical protein
MFMRRQLCPFGVAYVAGAILVCLFSAAAFAASWTKSPGEHSALRSILIGGSNAQSTKTEPIGLDDTSAWSTDILGSGPGAWNHAPVDLSFLNASEKPAGKHGFMRAVGGKLVFEDGTAARFWGANLTAYALFGNAPRDEVRRQARRLSQLGFNLIRFHHHDSLWVTPNIFGDRSVPDTKHLNPEMMKKLDWWIKCLKDEGIYAWLDLEVLRSLRAGDGIDNFDEISKGTGLALVKGYNYINPSIRRAMEQFNQAYLDHVNPFTGLRYKDDPAIVALLLTNENDVTFHFGSALLPNKNVPRHTARYMSEANAFAAKFGLPADKVWHAWEDGPSKLFLNDLEHRFDVELIGRLRKLGVKLPIVTTSYWGEDPLSSLPALTTGDLIDAHAYARADELRINPISAPTFADWIAAAHVANMPLTVTEWNAAGISVPDRHSVPLYAAGFASLQGVDAMMLYAYSQQPAGSWGVAKDWSAFNDPALIATLPAAALLYRRHDVRESSTTYIFAPTPQQLFDRNISPINSVALRTAAEKGKLMIALPRTPELPWLEQSSIPAGATVITDPNQSFIDGSAEEATSDTGELQRNWQHGIYTINTPFSQAAMGRIGGESLALPDVLIDVLTQSATVAVQSLDESPIARSKSLLVSLGARSVVNSQGTMPYRSEPVIGRLTIRAKEGLKLYALRGTSQIEFPASYDRGRYRINLNGDLNSYWLLLK